MSRLTRPTVFVIVGDHAPPFGDQLRSQFLKSEVPYVLLLPRKNQAGVR
jgi:phosphoglycerol transferase MdoB-like AlkP superfamily enzyme